MTPLRRAMLTGGFGAAFAAIGGWVAWRRYAPAPAGDDAVDGLHRTGQARQALGLDTIIIGYENHGLADDSGCRPGGQGRAAAAVPRLHRNRRLGP